MAAQALGTAEQGSGQRVLDMIGEGQRRGEVREGPWQSLALPVFTTLRGYAGLAAGGTLPNESAEHSLNDVIAYIL